MAEGQIVPEIDVLVHEPARLRVLVLLAALGRADFMYLLRQSGMSKGNLSVQMTRLEEGGIVSAEKSLVDGRPRTTFALTSAGCKALGQYKRAMGEILAVLPD